MPAIFPGGAPLTGAEERPRTRRRKKKWKLDDASEEKSMAGPGLRIDCVARRILRGAGCLRGERLSPPMIQEPRGPAGVCLSRFCDPDYFMDYFMDYFLDFEIWRI